MRVLITGACGFVGPYVADALQKALGGVDIIPTSQTAQKHDHWGDVMAMDITDPKGVAEIVRHTRCTHVIHLAGLSNVPNANADPRTAWRVNLEGTLNIADAIQAEAPECVLVFAGSGMAYGRSGRIDKLVEESDPLEPIEEYAATKAAADLALGARAQAGLHCIRLRLFNHTGPGQTEQFVVPNFAMQIARIEAGLQEPTLHVGNLASVRDFLDVRDVAQVYALIVRHAGDIPSGSKFNVASGQGRSIQEVLDGLCRLSASRIETRRDPARMRPSNLPYLVGNAARLRECVGWAPQYTMEQSLADILAYSRDQVARQAAARSTVDAS